MAQGWRGQYGRYKEFFLNIVVMYKKREELRMFTETILSLATIIIFLVFALKPTIFTIIDLTREINKKRQTVSELKQKVSDLEVARGVFENLDEDSKIAVKASIPTSPEPENLAKQIQNLATNDSVTVSAFSVGQVVLFGKPIAQKVNSKLKPLAEGSNEMNFSLSLNGSYENINLYIKDLEKLIRPIKIDSLTINSSETGDQRFIVALISGRVSYLK